MPRLAAVCGPTLRDQQHLRRVWPAMGSPDFIVPRGNMMLTGIAVPALAVVMTMAVVATKLSTVRGFE